MDCGTGLGLDLQERVDSNVGASPGYTAGFYTAIIKVRTNMEAEMESFVCMRFVGIFQTIFRAFCWALYESEPIFLQNDEWIIVSFIKTR